MLRSFRLENYRSFADEQELLLMPAAPGDERPAVPVTALYGANASGKSNLLNGLAFMRSAVIESFVRWDVESGVPRKPFRLSPTFLAKSSVFVVEFIADGAPHTYGFQVDDDMVIEEWLYTYPQKRKRIIFERHNGQIELGSTVDRAKSKLEVLEELTRPNALFLSAAARVDLPPLMPAYRWFRSALRVRRANLAPVSSRFIAERVQKFLSQEEENTKRLVSLLAAADIGITNVWVERFEDKKWSAQADGMVARVARLRETLDGVSAEERSAAEGEIAALDREIQFVRNRARNNFELKFSHGDDARPFELDDESDGTRSWLDLLLLVLDSLDRGHVVVVDEIDGSLHPLLTARLVALFQDEETNPCGAQLILSTHDTSLLGTMLGEEVLHREQIWFVQKSATGASGVYPLTDFKPRKEENTERRYLGGRYGAVPVLNEQDFVDAAIIR